MKFAGADQHNKHQIEKLGAKSQEKKYRNQIAKFINFSANKYIFMPNFINLSNK